MLLSEFVENAEEDGLVAQSALDQFVQLHELDEEETAELRAELEVRGVQIEPEEEDAPELDLSFDANAGGVPDSLTLFMNQLGRYKLAIANNLCIRRPGLF